jgi:uncharacterized membrane protein
MKLYPDINIPKLIEVNTANFVYRTLQSCHERRVYIYSWLFNMIILCIFIIGTLITLYYCAKRKKTPEEKERESILDQQYILRKIRDLKYTANLQHTHLTNLPIPM